VEVENYKQYYTKKIHGYSPATWNEEHGKEMFYQHHYRLKINTDN
jgi:hypothetical protein